MRVAVNLNFFFTDVPLLERYAKAAEKGFKLVELPLPYSEPAEDLKKAADKYGIRHVLINAPAGDWANGSRGIAALAGREKEFRDGISQAIYYAKVLDCHR